MIWPLYFLTFLICYAFLFTAIVGAGEILIALADEFAQWRAERERQKRFPSARVVR